MLKTLTEQEVRSVSGATWAHIATAVAVSEALYEFYQGYSDNRK